MQHLTKIRRAVFALLVLLLPLAIGCQRDGATVTGDRDLPENAEVRFIQNDNHEVLLSTNAARHLIDTLHADARYYDRRGMSAAPYGRLKVGGHEYFFHHGFVCDDLSLKGRFWEAPWMQRTTESFQKNGVPDNAGDWGKLFEAVLTGPQDSAGHAAQ